MWKALRTCAGCVSSCWCHLSKLWTVSRSDWSTVLIHAFNRYWVWFAYKLLVWGEGYSSILCNRVGSLTWNRLLFASICEGWFNGFIDWNQWITTLEGWGTCLWKTLRACAGCASSCRSYFRKLWTISCSHWSTILIYTFDCNWIWVSDKLLVWSEGYCSVWRNCIGSLTWNRLLFASICEGWFNGFIDWNQWITTFKCWGTCLWKALRACASCVSARWNYFFHHRLVLNGNRSAVGIHTSQFKLWCFTLELFIRSEGHLTICVHFELTNIWHFFHSCPIVK